MVSISRRSSVSNISDASQPFEDAVESLSQQKFSPEEEQRLVAESNTIKVDANSQFAHGEYSQAIGTYDRALASCPNYLDYEIAVLKSNIAACHVKLEDWKAAVASATQGIEALDRAEGKPKKDDPPASSEQKSREESSATTKNATSADEDSQIVELDEDGDVEEQLRTLQLSDERKEQIAKLRTKLLLRRAKGNQEQDGWGTLSAAETDYKELITFAKYLPDRDQRYVRIQLNALPARVKEAQEREVGEMMGKLKDLGNSILKPFGLSTNNFKMVKDEKTGGYSMNFEGNSGK